MYRLLKTTLLLLAQGTFFLQKQQSKVPVVVCNSASNCRSRRSSLFKISSGRKLKLNLTFLGVLGYFFKTERRFKDCHVLVCPRSDRTDIIEFSCEIAIGYDQVLEIRPGIGCYLLFTLIRKITLLLCQII